jgi:hypothetical protein
MTAAELNPELRKLIDARLDAIDRILVGAQVAWSERRSIVGEVETQIFELLARRSQLPTHDDVLAVISSLDPPESYLPEEQENPRRHAPLEPVPTAVILLPPSWKRFPQQVMDFFARFIPKALCVIGLVVVNGIVIALIVASGGVIPWIVTLGGLAWLNFALVRHYRAWSVTRNGHIIDDLRHSLAAWLIPKNGTQTT